MTEQLSLFFAEDYYTPIPRLSKTIPFGYKEDPNDPDMLLPIEYELLVLEKAKEYLKNYSYRVVANWVTETTGRYISHVGLRKRFLDEKARAKKLAALRTWNRRNQERLEKIRAYERTRLGAKDTTYT